MRVAVLHGVTLDQLGRRDPEHYGGLSYEALITRIRGFAEALGWTASFFQTNHEGVLVEHIHRLEADGIVINPGAWTHYAYALRDALELTGRPVVEVHLSDVDAREPFRRVSVLEGLRIGRVSGLGVDGYREALHLLKKGTPR